MRKLLATIAGGLIFFAGIVVMIGLVRLTVDFLVVCWRMWGKAV